MTSIPRETSLDSTLQLLSDPYRFISKRCREHGSDLFRTRIMLRKAVCMTGEEAASEFYRPGRFTRRGAIPITALMLLQDRGSAMVMDGEAHRRRKRMLMSLMSPPRIQDLVLLADEQWRIRQARWEGMREVVLSRELWDVFCRAVCAWAGVPLFEDEAGKRAHELGAMFEGAGAMGPRNWRGLLLRARTERWARGIVTQIRESALTTPVDSAAHVIAWHRDPEGRLLDTKVAAVELINILRPTVAVERYVTLAALALHDHPQCRPRLEAGDEDYLEMFVQEVRRFYPCFPAVGGRVREEFDWRGHHFARGEWVMLDLFGTNHDPRAWDEPGTFRPERFRDWNGSPFNPIPQGGGDHHADHRCAGEWITIELMKGAVRQLTTGMRYDVPRQDLRLDWSRLPAIPRSRFVITNVRRAH